ncbi:MAG: septum formation initiator family protein [Kiritimatiellae bacterium]|jgi:cell division protein FtsB|nr:septum formation initiator family protein [Kiritimatiellia bacterium]
MNDGLKEKVAKIVTISLLAIIGSLGALSVWPTYLRGQSLKRQDAELTRRIEEKKREIARLIDFQKRFKTDPDLVERIARQNGRVYPGELVFIFED